MNEIEKMEWLRRLQADLSPLAHLRPTIPPWAFFP